MNSLHLESAWKEMERSSLVRRCGRDPGFTINTHKTTVIKEERNDGGMFMNVKNTGLER